MYQFLQNALREGMFCKEENGISCSHSGSAVTVRFIGSEFIVYIKDLTGNGKSWVNVQIDNLAPRSFRIDPENESHEYILADDLPWEEHSITLQKRTEAAFGTILFENFSIAEGTLLPPPPKPRHHLLIIGDSITCGFGNEAQIPSDVDASRENFALTYGYIASRLLHASILSCSASGTGVYQNFAGVKEGRMSDYFMEQFCPSLDTLALDPFYPDAAVINLGTNDWSAPITPKQYTDRYHELLVFFRKRYPTVPLICAIGPMNSAPAPSLSALVDAHRASGDKNIHFLEFPLIDRTIVGFGGAGHPSIQKHQEMGKQLAAKLLEIAPSFSI